VSARAWVYLAAIGAGALAAYLLVRELGKLRGSASDYVSNLFPSAADDFKGIEDKRVLPRGVFNADGVRVLKERGEWDEVKNRPKTPAASPLPGATGKPSGDDWTSWGLN
jgi:hypothetical protein